MAVLKFIGVVICLFYPALLAAVLLGWVAYMGICAFLGRND
jgi:hypothetical protein